MSNTYFNISDKLRLYEFDGMLDKYGDATAAYSLRKLRNGYTGDAIRVRRSSDDAERDMGFYDNELDTVALLDWVNEEVLHFDADFNDPTGWTFAAGATMAGGVIDFNNVTQTTGAYKAYGAIPYEKVRVTFTIANYASGGIDWANYGGGYQGANFRTADGTYVDEYVLGNGNLNWGFWANGFTGSITQFKVEIIGSNGHVQTWYDQSANTNHAVQSTDTAQPKIVDAGTLVTDNGKPAIIYDDVDDFFSINSLFTNADGEHAIYSVTNQNNLAGTILGITGGGGYYFRYTSNNPSSLLWYLPNTTGAAMALIGPTGQGLISLNIGGGTAYAYVNNVLNNSIASTGPLNSYPNGIGRYASGEYFGGYMQEIIAYEVSTITDRDNINTNINTYYNIY